MIRLFLDECGDSHNDLFLKVDSAPAFLQVADTYFLSDFLMRENETKEEMFLCYLDYIKEAVQVLNQSEKFVAFDLSDQYLGGLFLSKGTKGMLKVEYGWTKEIKGLEVNRITLMASVKEKRKTFIINRDWLISTDSLMIGLIWSVKKIVT
jgi:hypothetical protein